MSKVLVGPSTIILWIAGVLPIVYAIVKAVDDGLDMSAVILAGIGAAMLAVNNYNRSKQSEEQIKANALVSAATAPPGPAGPPGPQGPQGDPALAA